MWLVLHVIEVSNFRFVDNSHRPTKICLQAGENENLVFCISSIHRDTTSHPPEYSLVAYSQHSSELKAGAAGSHKMRPL
jgi:hypothetical protein